MLTEVEIAVTFIATFLYGKVPRRKVELLSEHWVQSLSHRFKSKWYHAYPREGAEFRQIPIKLRGFTDPLIAYGAQAMAVSYQEILSFLPSDLIIWINPGEVSYMLSGGTVVQIYKDESLKMLKKLLEAPMGRPCWDMERPDSLPVSNASNLFTQPNQVPQQVQYSPSFFTGQTEIPAQLAQMNSEKHEFTVGSFAMTRFGSTRIKPNLEALMSVESPSTESTSTHSFSPSFSPPTAHSSIGDPFSWLSPLTEFHENGVN